MCSKPYCFLGKSSSYTFLLPPASFLIVTDVPSDTFLASYLNQILATNFKNSGGLLDLYD